MQTQRIPKPCCQMQQSITTTTRTITYDYDGLQRLTSASENPGTTQTYSYDLAGNRTGVWVNGTTRGRGSAVRDQVGIVVRCIAALPDP